MTTRRVARRPLDLPPPRHSNPQGTSKIGVGGRGGGGICSASRRNPHSSARVVCACKMRATHRLMMVRSLTDFFSRKAAVIRERIVPSGRRTPYAALIQGTLRSRSRWSERTRGVVSCSEVPNASDFASVLRSARRPDDEPTAEVYAAASLIAFFAAADDVHRRDSRSIAPAQNFSPRRKANFYWRVRVETRGRGRSCWH